MSLLSFLVVLLCSSLMEDGCLERVPPLFLILCSVMSYTQSHTLIIMPIPSLLLVTSSMQPMLPQLWPAQQHKCESGFIWQHLILLHFISPSNYKYLLFSIWHLSQLPPSWEKVSKATHISWILGFPQNLFSWTFVWWQKLQAKHQPWCVTIDISWIIKQEWGLARDAHCISLASHSCLFVSYFVHYLKSFAKMMILEMKCVWCLCMSASIKLIIGGLVNKIG